MSTLFDFPSLEMKFEARIGEETSTKHMSVYSYHFVRFKHIIDFQKIKEKIDPTKNDYSIVSRVNEVDTCVASLYFAWLTQKKSSHFDVQLNIIILPKKLLIVFGI